MGEMVNPGNDRFAQEIHSWIYVDKTGLLDFTNRACFSANKFICNSRPRRFGKSYAADMLAAYYSRGCDSGKLFEPYEISRKDSFAWYLNKCDVICFDVQWCMSAASSDGIDLITWLNRNIIAQLREAYPEADLSDVSSVYTAMYRLYRLQRRRFVVIIDEWDAPIRDESYDLKAQTAYMDFLRGMFKGGPPMEYIQLAYLTGILPIRKQRTQSALNNFLPEYTMISAGMMAEYIGFTDEEVQRLCRDHDMDYETARKWYDGYQQMGYQIYNPSSLCSYILKRTPGAYWTATASFDPVRDDIQMNFEGLREALTDMLAGLHVRVNTDSFENHTDREAFRSKDDVFTYMIHLGYLAYDPELREAFIPNEEIRQVLGEDIGRSGWSEYDSFEKASIELLDATIRKDGEKVAEGIEKIHDRYAASIWYNNENSLAAAVTIGYLATLKYYFKPVREMPAGKGFADIVYIPRPDYRADFPALIVELKWNGSVQTALDQVREKKYPESFREYTGTILLVGINYDRKTKKHTCGIAEDVKDS